MLKATLLICFSGQVRVKCEYYTLAGGLEFAESGHRCHQEQAAGPHGTDEAIGVRQSLPAARPQRVADGVVALHRDRHQRPHRDGDRHGCEQEAEESQRHQIHCECTVTNADPVHPKHAIPFHVSRRTINYSLTWRSRTPV